MLALIINLFKIRLIAYRLSFATKRPPPRGQEGIGPWEQIVRSMSFIGVATNIGLAVFVLEPLRDLPLSQRCVYFLAAEHSMLFLKLAIMFAVGDKSDAEELI